MSTKIGVIGCGQIAEKHFSAYKQFDSVNVVATDIDPSKQSIVEDHGFAWCSDTETLLSFDVDAVDICTPVTTHESLIMNALGANKDIFCEKPLAETVDQAERIYEATEASDNTLMVGYLYRYHPAFQFARDILDDRVLGDPYYGLFRVGGRGSASAWKHKASSGGGAANEMLVHMLDLAIWYFGSPLGAENLDTDIVLEQREIDGETVDATAEDLVMLKFGTEDDVDVVCQSDLITPSYMNYVEIQGTNGTLWTTILDYFPSFVYCKEPRGIFDRGHNFREFDRVDLFERQLAKFVDCVREGREPDWNSVRDSVEIHRIINETLD